VTPLEALQAAEERGVTLRVKDDRLWAPREALEALEPFLRNALRQHRDRLAAVLQLREVHRHMGFPEEDVRFIESAFLSSAVSEIRICALPVAVKRSRYGSA